MSATYLVSAIAAVVAGLCLAAAGVMQQKEASRRPSDERLSPKLLRALVTDRTWLMGIGFAVLSYGFQAVALALGPLTLVQPLIVSELLFAVPISVRLRNLRLRPRDWLAMLAVVGGLTVGMVAAAPTKGQPLQPILVWLPGLVAVAVVAGGCVLATWRLTGPVRASAYALGGSCVMGLQSALYAATIALLRQHGWSTFITWQPYALVVASVLGLFLIQNAFQAGPLAASTPVIDATLPLVAIALGVGMFNEQVRTSPLGLAGAGVGIVLLIAGIVLLDTSPVVRREQRIEEQEQTDSDA
ncbi:MAG: DMT family transporter [Nocardioidaceae bacterium]